MNTSLVLACWTAAVTLGLYAFYCYWEAGRADLAASFRHHVVPGHLAASASGASYRIRARLSLLAAGTLAAGSLLSVL